jgi:predicted dehydrogenase/acetyltransferase-like isoleucine patch superfamily enzyme
MADSAFATPRVAVIGCGYWGKNLVRDFAGHGALEAIVEANPATRAELSAKHGARALELDAALADPAIDGVVIAAPAELHHGLARAALEAGKHVYVEKPLALGVKEGEELVALASRRGRVLMVGHLLQYHPAFLALKAFVASGAIGRITYVYSNRLSYGILRREEDVLWSFAPHDLSMILGLVGEEPSEVSAFAAPTLHPVIGDFCQVQMAFPGGARGHVFCSWLHPFKEQRLVVVGERGAVVFEDSARDPADKLKHYAHGVEWINGVPRAVKGPAEGGAPIPYGDGNPLKDECRHFLDSIASGAAPRTDGAEGLRVLRVLERASAALKAGQTVQGAPANPPVTPPASRVHPNARLAPGSTVHESAYVDDKVTIGAGSKIWHFSHILGDVTIGEKCNIGQNVVIGPKVTVGNNVKIQNNVSVYEGVVLEDGVFCGPSCVFTNVNNPRAEIVRKSEYRLTHVRRGASIGANATIVCGHELGPYCFIAAGAVVARDVPAFALMAGVPARRIGWMSHAGAKLGPDLVCPETGRAYRQTGPDTLEEIA